jgi:hypothetical protein
MQVNDHGDAGVARLERTVNIINASSLGLGACFTVAFAHFGGPGAFAGFSTIRARSTSCALVLNAPLSVSGYPQATRIAARQRRRHMGIGCAEQGVISGGALTIAMEGIGSR